MTDIHACIQNIDAADDHLRAAMSSAPSEYVTALVALIAELSQVRAGVRQVGNNIQERENG